MSALRFETISSKQKICNIIINQPIEINIGYGGVIFVEIGEKLKPAENWGSGVAYRQMYFFVDEMWEIQHKGITIISRFGEQEDKTVENALEEIANKKITNFSISDSFKETIFEFGDYKLIIKQTEELETWDFYHRTENLHFTLTGKKKLVSTKYVFEKPKKYKPKKRKKTDFDDFYKEDLPLSQENAEKLLHPLIGFVTHQVREYTAVAFTLESKDEAMLISIDSDWQLLHKNKEVLSSKTHRYNFTEKLTKYLQGKRIEALSLNADELSMVIKFGDQFKLNVEKSKRYSLWTVFNRLKGYHVSADANGNFDHIIICPEKLKEKYFAEKHGTAVANCLYALDLYRELIS